MSDKILNIKLLLLLCYCFAVQVTYGQNNGEGLIAEDNHPTLFNPDPYAYTIPASTIEKNYPFEAQEIQKQQAPTTPYQAGTIERSHYVDNPFDIEDFSNPFNLPRPGSSNFIKKQVQKKKRTEKFVSDLFEHQNQSKQSVIALEEQQKVLVPSWMFFVLLGLFSFFTYMLAVYRQDIRKSFQNLTNTQYREQVNHWSLYSILSYLLFVLSLGSYLFLSTNMWLPDSLSGPPWSLRFLFLTLFGVGTAYAAKYLKIKLIASIFPIEQELNFYNYMIANTNKVLGFLLVPCIILMTYTPDGIQSLFNYSTLFIIASAYLYRSFRTILVARETILFYKFHFFIYLCSVELAPLLIILKFLSII